MIKSALDIEEIMVEEETVEVPLDLLKSCHRCATGLGHIFEEFGKREALSEVEAVKAQLKALIDESSAE